MTFKGVIRGAIPIGQVAVGGADECVDYCLKQIEEVAWANGVDANKLRPVIEEIVNRMRQKEPHFDDTQIALLFRDPNS